MKAIIITLLLCSNLVYGRTVNIPHPVEQSIKEESILESLAASEEWDNLYKYAKERIKEEDKFSTYKLHPHRMRFTINGDMKSSALTIEFRSAQANAEEIKTVSLIIEADSTEIWETTYTGRSLRAFKQSLTNRSEQ